MPKTLLIELHGMLEAPVDTVCDLLFDVAPGGRSPLVTGARVTTGDGDDQFTAVAGDQRGGHLTVEVDRVARSIALQGQWWYRGETHLAPHERGCLVTRRVFNVADRVRWAVPLVARNALRAAPAEFAATLRVIGQRLGCDGYPQT